MHNQLKLLYRFYSANSSFVHGNLESSWQNKRVFGQEAIHRKFMELEFNNCQVKIHCIKSTRNSEMEVEVQVAGELSNNGRKMKKFMQTWILVPTVNKKLWQ